MLEGFVDLIYEEDDGSLVVVDYKTDAVTAGAILARAAFYIPQVEAYARTARAATSKETTWVLGFVRPTGEPAIAVAPAAAT